MCVCVVHLCVAYHHVCTLYTHLHTNRCQKRASSVFLYYSSLILLRQVSAWTQTHTSQLSGKPTRFKVLHIFAYSRARNIGVRRTPWLSYGCRDLNSRSQDSVLSAFNCWDVSQFLCFGIILIRNMHCWISSMAVAKHLWSHFRLTSSLNSTQTTAKFMSPLATFTISANVEGSGSPYLFSSEEVLSTLMAHFISEDH